MYHLKSDIGRLYIPRKEGGSGMMQLESSYKMSTIGQRKYISTTTDWMLQLVLTDDKRKKVYSMDIHVSAKEFEKLPKYRHLPNEVGKTWLLKTWTIPVVVGALGLVKKGTAKQLEKIPDKENLVGMQKNSTY